MIQSFLKVVAEAIAEAKSDSKYEVKDNEADNHTNSEVLVLQIHSAYFSQRENLIELALSFLGLFFKYDAVSVNAGELNTFYSNVALVSGHAHQLLILSEIQDRFG